MRIEFNGPFKSRNEFIRYFTQERSNLLDKNELIVSVCKDKTVLDLGCIDHSYKTALSLGNNWLHKRIKDTAKEVTGIDNLEEDAKILNQYDYNTNGH